jgi:hypothetical protein
VERSATYRGYQIRVSGVPVADVEEESWLPQAMVRVPGPAGTAEQRVPDPDDRTFETEEGAEEYALHLATRWVDRHGT